MRMKAIVPVAALILAACGGGEEETADPGAAGTGGGDTMSAAPATVPSDTAGLTPGTVDTAGVSAEAPTAGGQVVDTAAVPGAVDTTKGTTTAP